MTGMVQRNRAVGRANRGAALFLRSAKRHNFLMKGAMARWLAALSKRLQVPVDSIFLDLPWRDL
jgi:hypothetical protein